MRYRKRFVFIVEIWTEPKSQNKHKSEIRGLVKYIKNDTGDHANKHFQTISDLGYDLIHWMEESDIDTK